LKYGFENSIRFVNKSKRKQLYKFELRSSRPDIMQPEEKYVNLRGRDEVEIFLKLTASKSKGTIPTYLFIQCAELVMHEVIRIDVQYAGK